MTGLYVHCNQSYKCVQNFGSTEEIEHPTVFLSHRLPCYVQSTTIKQLWVFETCISSIAVSEDYKVHMIELNTLLSIVNTHSPKLLCLIKIQLVGYRETVIHFVTYRKFTPFNWWDRFLERKPDCSNQAFKSRQTQRWRTRCEQL